MLPNRLSNSYFQRCVTLPVWGTSRQVFAPLKREDSSTLSSWPLRIPVSIPLERMLLLSLSILLGGIFGPFAAGTLYGLNTASPFYLSVGVSCLGGLACKLLTIREHLRCCWTDRIRGRSCDRSPFLRFWYPDGYSISVEVK